MKCYYDKQDYDNAVIYADKVLANAKTDDNVSDAQIIIARSAMKTGDEEKQEQLQCFVYRKRRTC
jgi:hypothetical protein